MSPLFMYDGAYDQQLIVTCHAHGAIAMSHYLTSTYQATSAQPHDIRAAGMGAILNWERMPPALVGASRNEGQAIARDALSGVDKDCPRDGSVGIYFSVDIDVPNSPAGFASCDPGFQGINDVLAGEFSVHTYAEIGLINHLAQRNLVQGKQWLSMSEGFSPRGGYGVASPLVCMVQMHDLAGNWIGTDIGNTDRNTVTDPHSLAAWWPDGSIYQGALDMPLTAADAQTLLNAPYTYGTKTATVGQWLANGDISAWGANASAVALSKNLAALAAQVAKLQTTVTALAAAQTPGGLNAADIQKAFASALSAAIVGSGVGIQVKA